MECLYCGGHVLENHVCSECGLNQEFLQKAWKSSIYHYNQGLELARVRDLTGARAELIKSLQYYKSNIDARNLLGLIYYEMGYLVEAITQWIISTNYKAEKNLADKYLRQLQSNQGKLNAYNDGIIKYNMAVRCVQKRDYDMAMMQCRRSLSSNPQLVPSMLLLSMIYIHHGQDEKARKVLNRIFAIDRGNVQAREYLDEIGGFGKKYIYPDLENEFEEFLDEEDIEEDGEEMAKRKIREIIERGAAAEDVQSKRNLEVSSYQEIKYGKHNVMYLCAGLLIGVLAMSFLFMPAALRKEQSSRQEIQQSIEKQIANKNLQIANLQKEIQDLNLSLEEQKTEYEHILQANNGSTLDEQLMLGIQAYMTGNRIEAVTQLGATNLAAKELPESTRACIQTIVAGCSGELDTLRSEGITAYGAENYQEAIDKLKIVNHLRGDDPEVMYDLAKSYENIGDIEAASQLYQEINTRFPDSTYVTTLFQ